MCIIMLEQKRIIVGINTGGGKDNYQYVDGDEVGMKEVHLSKSKFAKPQGQTQYVSLTY